MAVGWRYGQRVMVSNPVSPHFQKTGIISDIRGQYAIVFLETEDIVVFHLCNLVKL